MKKVYIFFVLSLISLFGYTALGQNLEIIPESTNPGKVATDVEQIGSAGGSVWSTYNKKLTEKRDLGDKLSSGIMDWKTLLDYLAYLIRFLSQAGLFVGACFIIYAGYIYASNVFTGKDPSAGKTAISNAIIGVIVITFSYAIMKAVTAAFLT